MVRGFPSHFGHWRICGAAALVSFSSSEIIIVGVPERVSTSRVYRPWRKMRHCGGVPRQGSMDSIWLSLMPPEGCQHCWSKFSCRGRVPFSTTFWLMNRPVPSSVKAGKSVVVQAAKAIPGTNNVASAASFIARSCERFLSSVPCRRAGELLLTRVLPGG